MKNLLNAITLLATLTASSAMAQETPPVPAVNPQLAESFAAVCVSGLILTEKATVSCMMSKNGTEPLYMPKVAKAGDTFRNTGIGGEFNTLIRNLDKLQSAVPAIPASEVN
jgi:hypothetical protein